MIEILREHKGKVVALYLRGNKDVFSGIIDKFLYDNTVLRMQCNKRYIYIDVSQISVIMNDTKDHYLGQFDEHVIPNAFT